MKLSWRIVRLKNAQVEIKSRAGLAVIAMASM